MTKFDCPHRLKAMVHDDMQVSVQNDRKYSEPLSVTNRVKLGCVMTPARFKAMFSAMLTYDFQGWAAVCPISYRLDGKYFNLRRLKADPRAQTDVLDKLFWHIDKMASGRFFQAFAKYDLTLSTKILR